MREIDLRRRDMKNCRNLFIGAVMFWVMCALAGLVVSTSVVYLVLRISQHY